MKTILVIDNRQAHKKIASLFPDFVVRWAANLSAAQAMLQDSCFDVVICPIEIGEESVFELLRHLSDRSGSKTNVLCWVRLNKALARFRSSLMDAATALGVAGFIGEECDDNELADSISKYLAEQNDEQSVRRA